MCLAYFGQLCKASCIGLLLVFFLLLFLSLGIGFVIVLKLSGQNHLNLHQCGLLSRHGQQHVEVLLGLESTLLLQVATQRVKTAQKAEIPHIDEPVSKIENVGVQTQNKLQDIKAAAEQIGVHGLSVVHNCITTGWLATISALDSSGAKYEFQCIWMVHQPTVHICGME